MDQAIGLTFYFILFFLIRCFTAIYVLRIAVKKEIKQAYILSMHLAAGALLNLMRFFVQILAANVIVIIDNALMAIFIHMTFYKDKKSPIYIILPTIIITGVLNVILTAMGQNLIIAVILDNSSRIIIGIFFALTSTSTYLNIKNIKSVEPWLKFRYLLVIVYGLGWISVGIIFIITPNPEMEDNIGTLALRIIFAFMEIIEFIAWVMPSRLKDWLNRNYVPLSENLSLSEQEFLNTSGNNN